VSYLRQKLDAFLAENPENIPKLLQEGKCTYIFDPSLDRSFNRGYTDYFVNERHQAIGSWESPKSKGQYIGKLIRTIGNSYEIENGHYLNNGDGLCFINENNEAEGIYVNKVENGIVYPNVLKEIKEGTFIYRNNDAAFIKIVEREDSAVRKISSTLLLKENETGFELIATDEDGNVSVAKLEHPKELTKNNESIAENFKINLAKRVLHLILLMKLRLSFLKTGFYLFQKLTNYVEQFTNNYQKFVCKIMFEKSIKW